MQEDATCVVDTVQLESLQQRGGSGTHTEKRLHEWAKPQAMGQASEEATSAKTLIGISRFQNHKKLSICCLSHLEFCYSSLGKLI